MSDFRENLQIARDRGVDLGAEDTVSDAIISIARDWAAHGPAAVGFEQELRFCWYGKQLIQALDAVLETMPEPPCEPGNRCGECPSCLRREDGIERVRDMRG